MRTFVVEEGWKNLLADPAFAEQTPDEGRRKVWETFFTNLPAVIGDLTDEPVNMQSLVEVQLRIIRHQLGGTFFDALVEVAPEEAFFLLDRAETVAMLKEAVGLQLTFFEELAKDVAAWVMDQGVTEDELMENPDAVGLNPEMLAAYRDHTLTIGGLLTGQPAVIIVRSDDKKKRRR